MLAGETGERRERLAATSFEEATSACVVMAPMLILPPSFLMPLQFGHTAQIDDVRR